MEEARRLAPPWANGCPCGLPTVWWEKGGAAAPPGGDGQAKGLHLLNSFTHAKQLFTPLAGNRVGWYICGPTVYDASHLGHARNYVSFDVLRRVMGSYFGYDVMFVENVTDIDDKIILRAHTARAEEVAAAARAVIERLTASGDAVAAARCTELLLPVAAALAAGEKSVASLGGATAELATAVAAAAGGAAACTGALAPAATAWDVQREYLALARRFEREFLQDMDALGVVRPDVLTRVSEFVPQIVTYIQAIIDKGLAYESRGSVYFDVTAFSANPHHCYGKLHTAALEDVARAMDGEGALAADAVEKRSSSDFVLWKRSKAGEPCWESPWGTGRPGWHIECSTMCSDVLGGAVDINCGGVDLAFPHHENQLAQSEAYWGTRQWVNFFLHTGHLHIEGLKMSKSLKNFITIRAALSKYTARQLRLLFLLHHWAEPMELTPLAASGADTSGMFVQCEPALVADKTFSEFFHAVKALLRGCADLSAGEHAWGARERELAGALERAKVDAHAALCDNVDTPRVLRSLLALVRACNVYMNAPAAQGQPRALLVQAAARYVSRILGVMGCSWDGDAGGGGAGGGGDGSDGASREQVLTPFLDTLTAFRDSIRSLARAKATSAELLAACDALRDVTLPELGVRVDDGGAGGAVWKLCDPEELRQEAAREAEARRAKEEATRLAKEEAARKAAEKEAKARVPPEDMFKLGEHIGQYATYDDAGFPLTTPDGQPLSKGLQKKLQKAREAQVKAHEAWRAASKDNAAAQ